jgi:D-aminoacyl-tRNA deacylase
MRAVVQRVSRAAVRVEGVTKGAIGRGLVVLVGVTQTDGPADAAYIATKTAHLRVFADDEGRMNRALADVQGSVLVISQFTLYGDVRGGRRPSFVTAAAPEQARALYEEVVAGFRAEGVPVETGVFQAQMDVELVNDGPVTLLLDSSKAF